MDEQNALASELAQHKADLDDVIISGQELMKLCRDDDAAPVAGGDDDSQQSGVDAQLTSFKRRYDELRMRSEQRLATMESALPLANNVQESHERLLEWLQHIEPQLRTGKELTGPEGEQQLLVRGQKYVINAHFELLMHSILGYIYIRLRTFFSMELFAHIKCTLHFDIVSTPLPHPCAFSSRSPHFLSYRSYNKCLRSVSQCLTPSTSRVLS